MSNPNPLVGLAGQIAATDWPDTTAAQAALDEMLAVPTALAADPVEVERLEATVSTVKDARERRQEAEVAAKRERETARRARLARPSVAPRVNKNNQFKSAQNEPEMEF